jgi:hypothetical protein
VLAGEVERLRNHPGNAVPEAPGLTADDIFRQRPTIRLWRSSRDVLALVVEILPRLDNDLARDLVEHLALTIVERDEELRAVRAVESFGLAQLHALQREVKRLGDRVARLLADRREVRSRSFEK